MTTIKWVPVLGMEGKYEVSDTGLVRSVDRVIERVKFGSYFRKGRVLIPMSNGNNYLYVGLGNLKKSAVHRVVLSSFCGYTEGKPEVNHIDGDKSNNSLSNLEWVSRSENNIHAYRTGLHVPYDMSGTGNPRYTHGIRTKVWMDKDCPQCRNTFKAKFVTTNFCSKSCSTTYHNDKRTKIITI